jgi:DNA-binding response OmpR family regulator
LAALFVSPDESDHKFLGQVFQQQNWVFHGVRNLGMALSFLKANPVPIVISERDLPLGDWTDLLQGMNYLPDPPLLIVTSRLADESLWSEVMNGGGQDVLAKPFHPQELVRVFEQAWRCWRKRVHKE